MLYRGLATSWIKGNFENSHKMIYAEESYIKLAINGSQEFSDKIQKYPNEIEDSFSVFQGTNSNKVEDALEVSKYKDETQEICAC